MSLQHFYNYGKISKSTQLWKYFRGNHDDDKTDSPSKARVLNLGVHGPPEGPQT